MDSRISRRDLLARAAAAAAAFLAACGPDPTPALRAKAKALGASLDCSDVSQLGKADASTRVSNEYRQHSSREDQFCLNCLNFVPAAAESDCATCKTVKGPINPDGWCKQWTQQRT